MNNADKQGLIRRRLLRNLGPLVLGMNILGPLATLPLCMSWMHVTEVRLMREISKVAQAAQPSGVS